LFACLFVCLFDCFVVVVCGSPDSHSLENGRHYDPRIGRL
jgi:hypothetical protein